MPNHRGDSIVSRCPDGFADGFVRSTEGWRTIMEIEFVLGV